MKVPAIIRDQRTTNMQDEERGHDQVPEPIELDKEQLSEGDDKDAEEVEGTEVAIYLNFVEDAGNNDVVIIAGVQDDIREIGFYIILFIKDLVLRDCGLHDEDSSRVLHHGGPVPVGEEEVRRSDRP
ncbi:MAG: hypothetical protein M1837_005865 [Sclerophora amabilis]|nr:MAG: hypothetical protein M1837_005865 [Sclerophora amabilis]